MAARSAASADLELNFPKRGRHVQEGLGFSTRFPFSFLRKTRRVRMMREVVVDGIDAHLPAVSARALTPAALRARFASPPAWEPEVWAEVYVVRHGLPDVVLTSVSADVSRIATCASSTA